MALKNSTVAYYYDEEIGNYNYGGGNPMRPHRVRLTHSLVENYGLGKNMLIHRYPKRSREQITQFHADDYVDFLRNVTPDNQDEFMTQMRRFNLGPVGEADCPVFDSMWEYFQTYTGGSVGGAALLNSGEADICLNWAGGMHHAKKAEASGFCYINDIVLAILELLKVHQRVLYIDIDIHHGDGVEEAFYTTDRVMTVSFHKYGDFFPGTGALQDTGYGAGKHYSVNVPLQEGMDDESYKYVFEPVMQKVMEVYQPGAVVMCCGADSLSGDRLGCFNLSLQGHSNCIEFVAKFGVPLMVLGGGGYTMRNVARCWCYETGRMLGLDLPDELPEEALREYDYYMDTHALRITVSNMKNANSRADLERIKTEVLRNLSQLPAAPSAPMQKRPPQYQKAEDEEEDMDVRGGGQAAEDRRIAKDGDYASDNEEDTIALGNIPSTPTVLHSPSEAPTVKVEGASLQQKPDASAAVGAGAAANPAPTHPVERLPGEAPKVEMVPDASDQFKGSIYGGAVKEEPAPAGATQPTAASAPAPIVAKPEPVTSHTAGPAAAPINAAPALALAAADGRPAGAAPEASLQLPISAAGPGPSSDAWAAARAAPAEPMDVDTAPDTSGAHFNGVSPAKPWSSGLDAEAQQQERSPVEELYEDGHTQPQQQPPAPQHNGTYYPQ